MLVQYNVQFAIISNRILLTLCKVSQSYFLVYSFSEHFYFFSCFVYFLPSYLSFRSVFFLCVCSVLYIGHFASSGLSLSSWQRFAVNCGNAVSQTTQSFITLTFIYNVHSFCYFSRFFTLN